MKKTATRHVFKFDATSFFTKNIGILGLVVAFSFLAIYVLMQRIDVLESRVIELEVRNATTNETTITPSVSMPSKK